MDISAMVIALLSVIGTATGSWMGVRQANKLVNWRIDQLEAKVMKHNNLVERVAVCERDIKSANCRIDQIKEAHP